MQKFITGAIIIFSFFSGVFSVYADIATTTVRIDICGDSIVTGNEFCDSGAGNNTGAYSSSTEGRLCNSSCSAWGAYCGDSIVQPINGEECDDGNNIAGDRCSPDCHIENLPSGGGGGGGGGGGNFSGGSFTAPTETRVIITGKAYPNSDVHVLKDGGEIGIVQADAKADFYFTTTSVTPGVTTFGFWAQDSSKFKSAALTTTLTVVSGVVTTISGALLPPTITIDKRKILKGDTLVISGESAPQISIVAHVHSDQEVLTNTTSSDAGAWKINFDTSQLADEDFHTVKANFETRIGDNVVQSSFSQELSFYVGQDSTGKKFLADLNGDSKVNLVDFSILLFNWGSAGPAGDLNGDHKVDLTDFSILLFNWTG